MVCVAGYSKHLHSVINHSSLCGSYIIEQGKRLLKPTYDKHSGIQSKQQLKVCDTGKMFSERNSITEFKARLYCIWTYLIFK